jgi:1,4-dihydroxy-2-naphthoate octaprenyltransferase
MPTAEVTDIRWWQALDPPIYLISVLPGAAVLLLAGGSGRVPVYVLTATLAVILLQHAINVLNDVSDWRLGADYEKSISWARYHRLNLSRASTHGYASLLAGGLLGLYTLVRADQLRILAFAVPLVLLGYLYNSGPRPLSYTHLGEWVTGMCYGPGVFGCLWWLTGRGLSLECAAGSVAFFALAVSLLLSHQPPQIATDRAAGKHTFAVRYGAAATMRVSRVLFAVFLLAMGAAIGRAGLPPLYVYAFSLSALLAAGFVLARPPAPRRILGSGSAVIIGNLLLAVTGAAL